MTLRRITLALLILYALITIYSILGRPLGIAPARIITPLVTLAGFAFALVHAGQREGWGGALRLLALVFGVSLLFESVGVATGWVYGPYHYTNKLGPLFLGLVPYLIPAAWFMMSYPSFVIADRLVPKNDILHEEHEVTRKTAPSGVREASQERSIGDPAAEVSPRALSRADGGARQALPPAPRKIGWVRLLAVAAVGGLVMTAWDLVMDPVMVAGGHWVWDVQGAYFGIPLQNFWGWWLTVFTTFALYLWMSGKAIKPAQARFDRLALGSYLVTGLGIVLAAGLSGAGALALIGFFAMVPWAVAGWLKME